MISYQLKRVFYSAYMPVSDSRLLPARQGFQPPLLREHRLYQADWLLRYYHFRAEELLDEVHPDFDTRVDPKCSWALRHMERFPVEAATAGLRDAAAGAGHWGAAPPGASSPPAGRPPVL